MYIKMAACPTVTVHTPLLREVFPYVLCGNPEFSARNRIFLRFLCIAKRVAGHGVNSNNGSDMPGEFSR